MNFITLAKLEDLEAREDVICVENNGVSGQDGVSNWYTVYYKDGTEEDLYTVSNINGIRWGTVKDKLEDYIIIDKENIGKDGSCIVAFTNEYGDYNISGKFVDGELIINDDELIYLNH